MGKLDRRFEEDRALRNTARLVFMADVEHVRTNYSPKGVADRVGGRIGDGAVDVFHVAKTHADDNRGLIAILLGALLVWLARAPIAEVLGLETDEQFGADDANADNDADAYAYAYAYADADTESETEAKQKTEAGATPSPSPDDGDDHDQ